MHLFESVISLMMLGGGSHAAGLVPRRVFCFGDSLTAGTSPPLHELFPYSTVLEAAVGPSVVVRHRGLPGAQAVDMRLVRVPKSAPVRAKKKNPATRDGRGRNRCLRSNIC